MLPTVVVANMAPGGPASRSNQLNIGDQVSTHILTYSYFSCFRLLQLMESAWLDYLWPQHNKISR